MAHKRDKKGEITKCYSFKVRECDRRETVINGLEEFKGNYNKVSKYLNSILTTMTIGEAAEHIPENKRNTTYYRAATDVLWRDKPLYEIFTTKFEKDKYFTVEFTGNSSNAENILYELIKSVNPEGYNGNVFGLSESDYRRHGYVKNVISNYKTKMRKIKPKVKQKSISAESSHEDMVNQCVYEAISNGLDSFHAYQEKIKYLKSKESYNEKLVERLELLSKFYKENSDEVNEKKQLMAVESLVEFGGCVMHDERSSMCFNKGNFTIAKKENANGYILTMPVGRKNVLKFDLWGRRDVIKNGEILVDIEKNHGMSVVLKYDKGDLYANITCDVPFNKEHNVTGEVVGIDVNTKHMLMVANVGDASKLDGYVNINKMLAEDKEFNDILGNDDIMVHIRENVGVIGFVPIESELLQSRVLNCSEKYKQAEERYKAILREQANKFGAEGKDAERMYLQNVYSFREYLKRLIWLRNNYNDVQSKYDLEMDYVDESTESSDKMDKRRFEFPFIDTETAKKMWSEIRSFEERLKGCRDWIVTYVYKLFEKNGYGLINMEYLNSSNFKAAKSFPSTASMLKFHNLLGKTREETQKNDTYNKYMDYYTVEYTDGKISNMGYSAKGKQSKMKTLAMNNIIKSVHFAETKDIMVRCANNGKMSVGYVPSFYTSCIDSKTHKLYFTEETKILNKKKVRKSQETHMNNMNADNNAAANIRYFGENKVWRETFCKNTKNGYNEPLFTPTVKSSAVMVRELKNIGAYQVLKNVE